MQSGGAVVYFGFLGGAVFAHPGAGGAALRRAAGCRGADLPPDGKAADGCSARPQRAAAAGAAGLCRGVFRIGPAGGDERHPCLHVRHGLFRAVGISAAGRGAHLPADAAPLALGALELSAGCAALRACTLAPVWKLCIASFLLSFGGLSILAQSRAAAADAGLEGRQLPGCKMLQGAIAAALTLLLAPLVQAGRWCAPTLGASTMMETAGPVMLLLSSVLLLYFRKKYHSILREGRV